MTNNDAIKKYNEMHIEVKRLSETYGYCHPMTERANIQLQAFRANLYQFDKVGIKS